MYPLFSHIFTMVIPLIHHPNILPWDFWWINPSTDSPKSSKSWLARTPMWLWVRSGGLAPAGSMAVWLVG